MREPLLNADSDMVATLSDTRSRAASRGLSLFGRGLREAALLLILATLPAVALAVYAKGPAEPAPQAQAVPADALWIDARSETDFARGHILGALNLNEDNWETALVQVFETWQPPRPIVVYCSAGCSASEKIAEKLTDLGIEPVEIYQGGFEAWKRSNG